MALFAAKLCLGWHYDPMPFGIPVSPILIVLLIFAVLLDVIAYLWRPGIPEGDRFVVEVGGIV